MTAAPERALVALGAVAGFAGVALSAAAAHMPGGPGFDVPARFLLVHAPALLGLAALIAADAVQPALGRCAGAVLVLGLALFCGDLILRAFRGVALLPMAAPIGGTLLMAGWALVALAALWPRRSHR